MRIIAETGAEVVRLLADNEPELNDRLLAEADRCRRENLGGRVYLRGLIEYSNYCNCNCFYCGLRRENRLVHRYYLKKKQITALARQAFNDGYQSICLQAGELSTDKEVDYIADVISTIKEQGPKGGQSLGITLSLGELSYQQYRRLWDAGAHRYLLRMETSSPRLFRKIHPPEQSWEKRLECLNALRDIGFQTGTGIMIGLPGQGYEDLAQDLHFFRGQDIDMLGMGPYIPHPAAPLAKENNYIIKDGFNTSIRMLALARIMMPDINIVASTALQSIHPDGLSLGLKAGANIIMPVLTPEERRPDYAIYPDKKFSTFEDLQNDICNAGYELALWQYGDSPHYFKRQGLINSSD